jgi:hypothetical protein
MPDWNTRLVVKLGTDVITPIDQFTPTFNTPHTILHSIEADNVGVIRQPMTFTFTMTVKANATAVAKLTEIAINATPFEVTLAEQTGTDWAFNSILFSGCLITSTNPSNVVIDGVPTASFNCIAQKISVEAP